MVKYVAKIEPTLLAKDINTKNDMKKFLTLRVVSSIEASSLVMGHHFVQSSFRVIFLNLPMLGSDQFKFFKTKKQINAMDDDEKNVFKETQLEYYCLRPKTVEFETMNIIDYFSKYEITVYYTTDLQKLKKKTNAFILKDVNNNIIEKKSKPSIVRYHRLDVSEGEKYYFQQLILYYPFRQISDLISDNNITKTYHEEWQMKNKSIINCDNEESSDTCQAKVNLDLDIAFRREYGKLNCVNSFDQVPY